MKLQFPNIAFYPFLYCIYYRTSNYIFHKNQKFVCSNVCNCMKKLSQKYSVDIYCTNLPIINSAQEDTRHRQLSRLQINRSKYSCAHLSEPSRRMNSWCTHETMSSSNSLHDWCIGRKACGYCKLTQLWWMDGRSRDSILGTWPLAHDHNFYLLDSIPFVKKNQLMLSHSRPIGNAENRNGVRLDSRMSFLFIFKYSYRILIYIEDTTNQKKKKMHETIYK